MSRNNSRNGSLIDTRRQRDYSAFHSAWSGQTQSRFEDLRPFLVEPGLFSKLAGIAFSNVWRSARTVGVDRPRCHPWARLCHPRAPHRRRRTTARPWQNRVCLTDIRQELVTKALPSLAPRTVPAMSTKLTRRRKDPLTAKISANVARAWSPELPPPQHWVQSWRRGSCSQHIVAGKRIKERDLPTLGRPTIPIERLTSAQSRTEELSDGPGTVTPNQLKCLQSSLSPRSLLVTDRALVMRSVGSKARCGR